MDEDSREPMTGTMDALSLCKRWLQACDDTHSKCNLPCTQTIPTRLIVLDNSNPRLIVCENLNPGVHYATLSHCWGAMIFVTLTRSNIQQFQRESPENLLPKTFREAIYICRYLGIQYLWIDSLCIIQDSTEDWDIESATMASVYGEAYLNIAATSAKDASVGCFFSRTPNWRCQVRMSSTNGEELYDFFHDGMLHGGENPLGSRAWVVQERYLSRRTIHFSEHQVFWECNENPASEVFSSGYPPSFKTNFMAAFVMDREMNLLSWPKIVDTYSSCALTKSSDMLIALAGLAKKIQEETSDVYITGMWRTNLEDQLCWHTEYGLSSTKSDCLALSWSWASIGGSISFPKAEDIAFFNSQGTLAIQVHDLRVQYASKNCFGDVTSAIIRISCNFLYYGIIEDRTDIEDTDDIDNDDIEDRNGSRIHFGRHTAKNVDIWFDKKNLTKGIGFSHCYLLPIRVAVAQDWSNGIILTPVGSKRGEFRRIGFYRAYDASAFAEAAQHVDCVAQRWAYHFAEVSNDQDGKEQFFIDIS